MKNPSLKILEPEWLENYSETLADLLKDGYNHKKATEIANVIVSARMEIAPYCGRRAALDADVTAMKTSDGRIRTAVDIDIDLVPQHLKAKVRKHPNARAK